VWDSVPEDEYRETLDKGKGFAQGIDREVAGSMDCFHGIKSEDFGVLYGFSLFEMFLVNEYGRVFLLEKHIDRLFN